MKKQPVGKIYMVVSEAETTFYASFKEAEGAAQELCETNDEEIQIFEVTKSWNVYYPAEPIPEATETSLAGHLE